MRDVCVTMCAIALLGGCNKSETAAGAPSASAAPAPAPTPGAVKYTTGDPAIAGDYDGTKAIARKSGSKTTIAMPKNCDALACEHLPGSLLDQDALKKACPKGHVLTIEVDKEPTAGAKLPLTHAGCVHVESGAANGLVLDGAQKNEIEVVSAGDNYVVKVDLDGMEDIQGVLSAKLCK